MSFFKITDNGYILSIGQTDRATEHEITEEEYNTILSVIRNKPPATETTDYRLRDDLTWEEYTVDPPDPEPVDEESDYAEAGRILLGNES